MSTNRVDRHTQLCFSEKSLTYSYAGFVAVINCHVALLRVTQLSDTPT